MILRGSVYSKVLEMDTGVTILTPTDFRQESPYRVAYILHGLHGGNGNWTDYTRLPVYSRDYNVVCIMPEASRSFYANMRYGQQFFNYIADELPALCAATFRIGSRREDTAVIGGSMGGYGALKCALSRPERYGKCAALSSACLFMRQNLDLLRTPGGMARASKVYSNQLVRDFQAIFGPDFDWKREDELLELAADACAAGVKPELYLACGTEDDLQKENDAFASAMAGIGYPVTYEKLPGTHDWPFFDVGVEKALRFCFGAES